MMSGNNLLKKAYASGFGISAGAKKRIVLDTKTELGEEFIHGNVLSPAKRAAGQEMTDDEQAGRQELINLVMS